MSKISTVYDTLLTLVPSLYSGKTELILPYDLDQNPEHLLRNGWAVRDVATSPLDGSFHTFVDGHGYEIVFTREIVKTIDQVTPLHSAYKLLKEDMVVLRKRLMQPDQLGIEASIERVVLGNTTPPETIFAEQRNFLSLGCNVTFEIRENL